MRDDPDDELIRQVAAGDGGALRLLMARHLPRIHALARRMLGDASGAEDVAQETFLRAWRTAPDWRPGTARFSTWMHRVALNLCYDALRRRKDIPQADPPEIVDTGPLPDAMDEQETEARAVEAALQRIAPRQREAIVLVYYQELPQAEAAAIMDVSVDALESLLARGRRALQAILIKEDDNA
jgi:RNA polymerase sigma-70 factor (ECF subfamily)